MNYRANLSRDIPSPGLPKRIVFYAQGLKIYGLLPHILNRRLKGEFISNVAMLSGWGRGAAIVAPTGEDNYTVIPYAQKPEHAAMLLDWLCEDRGFEWAIASPQHWNEAIREWNAYKRPPDVWVPSQSEQGWREGFQKAIEGDRVAMAMIGGR